MEDLRIRQKMNWEAMFYSSQRIDILIIAICGSGIYVCLETLKYLKENNFELSIIIKISGIIFVIGIIINFISQFYGRKANEYDFLTSQLLIDNKGEICEKDEGEYNDYLNKSIKITKYTDFLNYSSAIFMSIGLILLIIYFVFIF